MNTASKYITTPVLVVVLVIVFCLSASAGAVDIDITTVFSSLRNYFFNTGQMDLNERIFMDIRLPRVLLCLFVGASLAVGGILMQALFRNPIVEPGLVGTSSGAAFGAAIGIVLGASNKLFSGAWPLFVFAFTGAICSTWLVVFLSRKRGEAPASVLVLLLIGVAINALFMSGVGFLSYIARDPQARSITFWNLGTLSGASWSSLLLIGVINTLCIVLSYRHIGALNVLVLGEGESEFLGVNLKRTRRSLLLINVIMVAACTAYVGIISFIGIIVPHLLRIVKGPDNKFLLKNGALSGAILVCLADLIARIAVRPAELPIGIVTSFIGVPVFIFLLRKHNYYF